MKKIFTLVAAAVMALAANAAEFTDIHRQLVNKCFW